MTSEGRVYDTDGSSQDQPIMELVTDGLCIFDDGEGYSVRAEGKGELYRFSYAEADDAVWEGLAALGWTYVELDEDGDSFED